MADRDAVFPAGRHALYERHRYSAGVRSNGFLFVSGQVGAREDGSPEDGFEAQVHCAFANLDDVLAAAGLRFDDVVDVTMFVVDPERHAEALLAAMRDHWGEAPFPTLTAVGVTWLSGFLFEIKVVARLPQEPSST